MEKSVKADTKAEYRFICVMGEGAFARVYLAEDRNGRQYACKVSREVKLLEREAELLSGLHHPLFPAYMGYEEREGTGRLFMEYISGRNLGQMLRFRGSFSARQTMRIARELADGLRYLHERQSTILYRDLKPENIMVCQDGHVRLIDFGCACPQDMQGGERVGTPGFAPPEQLKSGATAGVYSDVYGLGRTIRNVMAEGCDGGGKCRDQEDECHRIGERRFNRRKEYFCKGKRGNGKGKYYTGGNRCRKKEKGHHSMRNMRRRGELRHRREEKICRRRLEQMIQAAVRDDFRQRPQDMTGILHILTGKREKEEGIICEKNIWESSYKNSCSLPLI